MGYVTFAAAIRRWPKRSGWVGAFVDEAIAGALAR
jgi:hypothetical protein